MVAARRRAGEQLDEEAQTNVDSSSKARTASFRLGRLIRSRPAAAVLLLVCLGAVGILALSTVHTVLGGRTHDISTSARSAQQADVGHALHEAKAEPAHGAEHGANNWADNEGIDGDKEEEAKEGGGGEAPANATEASCVRTLQDGRFGSKGPLCVTQDYYLDLEIGGAPIGRVTVGVFGRAVPKSAANWHALVTCGRPFDETSCFKGDSFHRVVPGFVIQGGSKATGRSIYGDTFREEVTAEHHSVLSHSEPGTLAWAEYPIGSQFYIVLADQTTYLDNNHVVFGYIASGMDVVKKIEKTKLEKESPVEKVTIADCGALTSTR